MVSTEHKGLSPSSLTLFTGCQRRYFYKKVVKVPVDSDVEEEVESLQVGKAFHQVLEDSKHVLEGFPLAAIQAIVANHELSDEVHTPLIFAMLKSYKDMHEKAGLTATHYEVEVSTDKFFGYVDVILQDEVGNWWIGDMKTAASFSQNLVPTLPMHPQLNLYAAHYKEIAAQLGLDPLKYKGCRYRLTTKSKMNRKEGEDFMSYVGRMLKTIKSFDFILPKEIMRPELFASIHGAAESYIKAHATDAEPTNFCQNFSNCMNFFRPCEFFSRCHGKNFSEMNRLEVITSE